VSKQRLVAIAVGLAVLAGVGALALAGRGPDAAAIVTVRADDVTIGDAGAPVVVVAYYSFTCAECADFHVRVLPAIKARWIDTGRARLVYRDLPRNERDLAVSTLSRCAAGLQKDRYLAWLDLLFRRQAEWTRADPLAGLYDLARETDFAGFDRLQVCQGNPSTEAAVLEAVARAERAGVRTVPAIFVQGRRTAPADVEKTLAALSP
jgi:protein-disulfide isomerase